MPGRVADAVHRDRGYDDSRHRHEQPRQRIHRHMRPTSGNSLE
ncbi:hypothetical protein O1M54_50325 [Streptomyces diastatochromogenes]|nr:hypothetical protein [Streptomyces diastatochromogenes]